MSIRFASEVPWSRTAGGRQLAAPVVNGHLGRAAAGTAMAMCVVAFGYACDVTSRRSS